MQTDGLNEFEEESKFISEFSGLNTQSCVEEVEDDIDDQEREVVSRAKSEVEDRGNSQRRVVYKNVGGNVEQAIDYSPNISVIINEQKPKKIKLAKQNLPGSLLEGSTLSTVNTSLATRKKKKANIKHLIAQTFLKN